MNEFIARNGLIAQNNSTISGSLNVTGGITGSLLGTATTASYVTLAQTASYVTLAQTASYVLQAVSSSYAVTASYALNGGGIQSKSATFDGQGGVININTKATFNIDFTGTVTGWQLFEISDTPISSTCVIDVWKDTYVNYPPTVADTIFGTKPSLTAEIKNESTGLSIAVTTGDIFIVNIDSNTNAVKLLLVLQFNIT
jgi:hypothetical protein